METTADGQHTIHYPGQEIVSTLPFDVQCAEEKSPVGQPLTRQEFLGKTQGLKIDWKKVELHTSLSRFTRLCEAEKRVSDLQREAEAVLRRNPMVLCVYGEDGITGASYVLSRFAEAHRDVPFIVSSVVRSPSCAWPFWATLS